MGRERTRTTSLAVLGDVPDALPHMVLDRRGRSGAGIAIGQGRSLFGRVPKQGHGMARLWLPVLYVVVARRATASGQQRRGVVGDAA